VILGGLIQFEVEERRAESNLGNMSCSYKEF
jgi:hypothetical protein